MITFKSKFCNHLAFDINLLTYNSDSYQVQVTENYEGDKYHCTLFDLKTNEHLDTQGFKTEKEIFEYLRKLERGKIWKY